MWPKEYEDYPVDTPLTKYPVETGKGIMGCEMHDLNGWGISYHQYQPKKKKSWFAKLLYPSCAPKSRLNIAELDK